MRLVDPKLALAGLSLVLVAFLVVLDLKRTSPGPLAQAHERAEGLDEGSCELCHGDGETTLEGACNECHTPVAEQLAERTGFHGALSGASDCGHCHVEHHGQELPLVDERAFALAGFEPRASYAHEGLEFMLGGRHDELDCVQCHARADVHALDEGEQRFLGASQECATCHEDPHEGRMVESCESCHGQEQPFADLAGFVHTRRFALEGAHAAAACADCHEPDGPHAVEALGGRDAVPDRGCAACHESPHTGPFVARVAAALEFEAAASCQACHALESRDFADFDHEATSRLHGAGGFELEAPHAALDCASCHAERGQAGEREPHAAARRADDCAACHDSPHGEQFVQGVFADFDCLACHARERFVPATFDAEAHARTDFALAAGHAAPGCADCHQPSAGETLGRADFGAVARECSGCHADAHAGLFVRTGAERAAPAGCDTCHRSTHFAEVVAEDFDHGRWTAFELDGAHADAQCEACHLRSPLADDLGRSFGRVSELFGEPPQACATCHTDVHVGAMAGASDDCAACHTTRRFAEVDSAGFEHGELTGFELFGAHARAECTVCHATRARADANGRAFGLVQETFAGDVDTCASCHDDPHAGRFERLGGPREVQGRVGCARCHDQESFLEGARNEFDHELWTGFALDGAHAEASCEDCHTSPTPHSLGRAPGARCAACHEDPHVGQFGAAARCEGCHESSTSFAELVFEHGRDSRFALDEQHAQLACDACHRPWPLADGGQAVRYKPLGLECADCHLGRAPR